MYFYVKILTFNRIIAENYIKISNKELFFECYEVIISVGGLLDFTPPRPKLFFYNPQRINPYSFK